MLQELEEVDKQNKYKSSLHDNTTELDDGTLIV